MNTNAIISHHHFSKAFNPNVMSPNPVIHVKSPSTTTNQHKLKAADNVISIFGDSEKKRAEFADTLAQQLATNQKIAKINLSKVIDSGFNVKLEQQKRQIKASGCPEQIRMMERLEVALDIKGVFEKPIDILNLEEKAKMLLAMELSGTQPDTIIINRPSIIRQFNRKIRSLRQVFKKTYIMTDQVWNFPLSVTSDRVFEVRKNKIEESFITL